MIRVNSTAKADLSYLNQYTGDRAVLASKLSNSIFERFLNEYGLHPEVKDSLTIHIQNKEKRLGTLLRKSKPDIFRKLCNEWRKKEMDLLFVPADLQEEMFNNRWKI